MSAENYIIDKDNVLKFIEILAKCANVLAPQQNEFGDMAFLPVEDKDKVILKAHKPIMPSARETLFGQIETMIQFEKKGKETKIKTVDQTQQTVIFGLPNCDAAGIKYTDNFFAQREFVDYYYKNARDKLILMTMACLTPPSESCFCASMKTGPFSDEGFDLQFTDMEDGTFFVNTGTEKGKDLISENGNLFKAATNELYENWMDKRKKAETLPIAKNFDKEKAIAAMDTKPLDEKLLADITDRCISCGACNFVCPTCTCFNVKDVQKDGKGIRQRIIDSCILSGYFRMAGGHNPKERKEQRTRNRYYCKILWDKNKFGDTGCVGCGRCLDACPVNIDIKEVFQALS